MLKRLIFIIFIPLLLVSCSSKSKEKFEPKEISDFNGHSVAVLLGSLQDMCVTEANDNCEFLRLSSVPEVLVSVSHGKAECALVDAASILSVDMEASGLRSVVLPGYESDIAIAVNKETGTELKASLDAYIKKTKEDGSLKEMYDRWLVTDVANVPMPKYELNTSGKTIEIGVMFNDMPFSFIRNNELVGVEIELLTSWAAATGNNIHFNNYEFSSLLASLQTGKIDMIACCLAVTDERKEKVLFTDPYYHCDMLCILPTDQNVEQISLAERFKDAFQKNIIDEGRWKMILAGLWETIVISFWSLIMGTILGSILCYFRTRKNIIFRGCAKVYIDLMRGIPILVFLMILFYVIFATSKISATWIAIIAFSCNFAAYVSEMFRSGIGSVEKGQYEAGWAMGFSKMRTFWLIIFPQSLRQILPVYKGEAVSLIKNTSIVGYIAIQDLTKVSDIIRSRTFDAFFPLLIITVIYFVLAWLLGLLLDRIKIK